MVKKFGTDASSIKKRAMKTLFMLLMEIPRIKK